MRKSLVERDHPALSVRRQCELLGVNRNRLNPPCRVADGEELRLCHILDELHVREPTYGTRNLGHVLERDHQIVVGRKRLRRLMKRLNIRAVYPGPRTSLPAPGHKVFPYLLRDLDIRTPNQVWCADITYIPMKRGYCYLFAILDWHSRYVLSWALSTTMDTSFCVSAFREAVRRAGCAPEIFNTDQGSQFTSDAFIAALKARDVAISMDGRGRAFDNIFIERFWRSLKYEWLYLHSFKDVFSMKASLANYIDFYNQRRLHEALGYQTPDEWHTSAPCGADFNLGLLSRSSAEREYVSVRPAHIPACVSRDYIST